MADQARRGVAWAYKNAASFGGDPNRLYVGGHSSGGHLCGVALVTDWSKDFGLPADIFKRRPVHERHVRHEAGSSVETRLLRQIR